MLRLPPALLLALPLLLGACFERTQPTVEIVPRPVQALRVALAPEHADRVYAGVIQPRREADIGFRAGGRVTERLVDMGARVIAGQELARLDPVDLALAVHSAEADLAAAEANLVQTQSDAMRSHTLAGQGWQAAETDEVKQAAARIAIQKVASTQAALTLARNKQDYATLRAPADGVVTAALADPGTVVTEGQPVLRIAETGVLEAAIALPEAALPLAGKPGASVTFWARPDTRLSAKLRELSPVADPKLRTYAARYTLPDAPAWLAIGMTATVHLADGNASPVAMLPAAALLDRGNGPMVWVIDPATNRLRVQPVALIGMRQDRAIVGGLSDGALVVGMGVQKLDPDAAVRVADIRPATE
ncbi:MAG TPA: efflux RND transporter periplasmic adaptor subunit [Acetobacteraceae bacterium]|nr:efflux RND transporter periplasmic adaptor subunit [Acetobacteraceae bacterium]